jgi:phage I-like protein
MLVTFKSKAAAEVVMYKEHARPLLELIGKDVQRGVITAAEAANAVAKLEVVIAESKVHPTTEDVKRDVAAHRGDADDDNDHEASQYVSFATRAYPLLEMLRAAQKDGYDVLWGV